tara:strand:+ start:767 stop:1174 length:408 start_codon:yes stop_codon:yes gene_type:complete
MSVKEIVQKEDIDFIKDPDAFKLLKLKIFTEKNVSNGVSKPNLMQSSQISNNLVDNSSSPSSAMNKKAKYFSLHEVLSMINSNDSRVLEKTFQIDFFQLANNFDRKTVTDLSVDQSSLPSQYFVVQKFAINFNDK